MEMLRRPRYDKILFISLLWHPVYCIARFFSSELKKVDVVDILLALYTKIGSSYYVKVNLKCIHVMANLCRGDWRLSSPKIFIFECDRHLYVNVNGLLCKSRHIFFIVGVAPASHKAKGHVFVLNFSAAICFVAIFTCPFLVRGLTLDFGLWFSYISNLKILICNGFSTHLNRAVWDNARFLG